MAANIVTKAIAPTAGRLAAKIIIGLLVALGIADEATIIGILDDPAVIAGIIALIQMLRHEAEYRRRQQMRQKPMSAGQVTIPPPTTR